MANKEFFLFKSVSLKNVSHVYVVSSTKLLLIKKTRFDINT